MFQLLVLFLAVPIGEVWGSNGTHCPTWFYYSRRLSGCNCGFHLRCNASGHGSIEMDQGYCATSADEEIGYYVGGCPFVHIQNTTSRMFFEINEDPKKLESDICGPFNRKGLLCGECIDGHGPGVYSHNMACAKCYSQYYAIPLYLFLELTPITLLFLVLIFFRVNLTSGPLLGYIVFCQSLVSLSGSYPELVDYILSETPPTLHVLFQVSITMSQFWSMHSFFKSLVPPLCISENMTGVQFQLLTLVPLVYSVFLVIITCILMELHGRNCRIITLLWKPFGFILNKINISASTGDAVIHAFASLILLSYLNTYYVAINVSTHEGLHTMNGSKPSSGVVYFDPTITYLSHEYFIYTIISFIPCLFLTVFPSIILIVYPTRFYSKCIARCLSNRKRLAITAFVEALQYCFKDGLSGTRDCRSLAGLMVIGPIPYSILNHSLRYFGFGTNFAGAIIFFATALVILSIRPCKRSLANISISFHLFLLGILCLAHQIWISDRYISTAALELNFIFIPLFPHIVLLTWICYVTYKHLIILFTNSPINYLWLNASSMRDFTYGLKQMYCSKNSDYLPL